jgi:hypothetical protein
MNYFKPNQNACFAHYFTSFFESLQISTPFSFDYLNESKYPHIV